MAAGTSTHGILSPDRDEARKRIIAMLTKAYWMEMETVMSYMANSVNPDGVRAQEIIESLREDIQEELGHAQQFASRIKELYGVVPGSMDFSAEQSYLQPPSEQTDIVHVIRGVIEAECGAIDFYNAIIEFTEDTDPVTNDMVIAILARRGGPPAPVRGLPARVRGRGQGLITPRPAAWARRRCRCPCPCPCRRRRASRGPASAPARPGRSPGS